MYADKVLSVRLNGDRRWKTRPNAARAIIASERSHSAQTYKQ